MKILIDGFYLTLFIATAAIGFYGDVIYRIWQEQPAGALQTFSFLYFMVWLFYVAIALSLSSLDIDGLCEWASRRLRAIREGGR